MDLDYVPTLQIQRDLYSLPRGPERFRQYIRTLTDPATGDLALPLTGMNPMGKDHLPAFLEALLEAGAEQEAAHATAEAQRGLAAVPGTFNICLVLSDDVHGGWTHRYSEEFSHRFEQAALANRGWIVGTLWASGAPTLAAVREEVRAAIFRAAYVHRHGQAKTLADMLTQEGRVMAGAGITAPVLEAADLDRTEAVVSRYLHHSDRPTLMAALFGDPAARELGYEPLGLAPYAGIALALSRETRRRRDLCTSS